MLTESLVLAAMGGVAGIVLAYWGIRSLTLLLSKGDTPFTLHPGLNWHVLGMAMLLSMLTGTLFGLAPALQAARLDVMPSLRNTSTDQARAKFRFSLGSVLIVSQVALSLLILVAAGLFVRTLRNVELIQLGFNRENLLLFQLNAQQAGHRLPEIATFYENLRQQFAAIPGVRAASHSHTPLIKSGTGLPFKLRGTAVSDETRILFVGPEFFATMQIPMLRGRDFQERDVQGAPVAVISQKFARANFGDEDPLGQHLLFDVKAPDDLQIVGVATDAHYGPLKRDIPPVVYLPYPLEGNFRPVGQAVFEVRTASDPLTYVAAIREIVHRADARVPVTNIETQTAEVDQQLNQEITFAKLCSAFALLALAIASIGLYGTMSYKIARRTSEFGIRMALGAQRRQVMWMVLRDVGWLAAIGLTLGLLGTAALSRLIESFLFKMKASDPPALALSVATLLCSLLIAAYIPARRASRIDPIVSLRQE
jgi:predicted permease